MSPVDLLSRKLDISERRVVRVFGLFLFLALLLSANSWLAACPFCSAPQLTLAEQIAQTDATVIAEWVSGKKPDFDAGIPGTTTYRIKKVIKSPAAVELKEGQEIKVNDYYPGEPGTFALMAANQEAVLNWVSPLDITAAGFDYVLNAPAPENNPAERLKYYLKFLESADPLIADDAYAEFANAPYDVIKSIKDSFPREKLRKWVSNPETTVTRLGLYGLMLGLCGDESDQEMMKAKIVVNDEDFRLGIDGVMAGYLLLAGTDGLDVIENSKLKPSLEQPSPVPFSETFASMQAIKFLWEYSKETVPAEQLRETMRILLDHPDLADLVIIDLARWEDWSILPRIQKMYDQEPYDVPAVKRAIVGYLIQCLKQKPTEPDKPTPAFVTEAENFLAHLEETDPKTVRTARLLFR